MERRTLLSPGAKSGLTRDVIARALSCGSGQRSDGPPAGRLVPAAVLVPLVGRDDGITVLLTQRTAHLANHPSQISFPGGRIEAADRDPIAAALRETKEEIGLSAKQVAVLGCLDTYATSTGFLVTPVVGWIDPPLDLVPDPFEVAEAFEVPLQLILDPANHERHARLGPNGEVRDYVAIPFEGRVIWGATAGMLVNLADVLRPCCES